METKLFEMIRELWCLERESRRIEESQLIKKLEVRTYLKGA